MRKRKNKRVNKRIDLLKEGLSKNELPYRESIEIKRSLNKSKRKSKQRKRVAYKKDFYRWKEMKECALCDCKDKDKLSRHHIIAKRKGGGDNFDNILILCRNIESVSIDCHDLIEKPIFNEETIPKIEKYNKILEKRGLSNLKVKIPINFSP